MDKDIKETLLVSFFYPLGNHHTVLICGASVIKGRIAFRGQPLPLDSANLYQ